MTNDDYNNIERASYEIGNFCRKWGRINVTQTKEKYGTARVYCFLGNMSLHTLVYPGYAYNQFPQWLCNLDFVIFYKIFNFKPISKLIFVYQKFIYNLAYKRTVKKYPNLREEILICADWLEFMPWAEDIAKQWRTND